MLPARFRLAAVLTALGVAIFSALPLVRWCSVSWADVRPECFIPGPASTACAPSMPLCGASSGTCKLDQAGTVSCEDSAPAASPASGTTTADHVPDDPAEDEKPERAFCPDGLAGGKGEPGPSLENPPAPAKAKAVVAAATPKLKPLTVHKPRAEATPAPRPPTRPGAQPPAPRAPPKNVFLHGVY